MNKNHFHFSRVPTGLKLLLLLVLFLFPLFSPVILTKTHQSKAIETSQLFPQTTRALDNLLGYYTLWWETGYIAKGMSIKAGSNGEFFFVGNLQTDFFTQTDFFIGMVNDSGKLAWLEVYQQDEPTTANNLALNEQQQLLFAVGGTFNSSNDWDIFLFSFNYTSKEFLWNTTIGTPSLAEQGERILYSKGKVYLTALQTDPTNQNSADNTLLYCINSSTGAILWQKAFLSPSIDSYPRIVLEPLTGDLFLFFNQISKANQKRTDLVIQRLLQNGTILWKKQYTREEQTTIKDMGINLEKEQLILVGDCLENNGNGNFKDVRIFSLNLDGEILTERVWGKFDIDEDVRGLSSIHANEFYVIGQTENIGGAFDGPFLAYFNSSLEPIWYRTTSGYFSMELLAIDYSINEEIVTTGFFNYRYDFFLKRLILTFSLDNDRDSLCNFFEEKIGTNLENNDTDADGYTDAEEYFASTDPLNPRSFPPKRKALTRFGFAIAILLVLGFFFTKAILFVRKIAKE
ncbi:MAG: thrombospondin type 3 repeat-containing protein [Candidatus Heimdallarchaeota archaeon]